VEATAKQELLDEVEQFLQHQMRRSDLLFRTVSHRWLIVAATKEEEDADLMAKRFENARLEVNRNRPSGGLPVINLEVRSACRGLDQSVDFIRCFETEYCATESCHAAV
jgi:GGDEF domain-containing protein